MIEVRAEMAANVWQVHVEPGQAVEEGDVLAILESMKMEIPVEAPASGIVIQILISPEGQVVEGDVMVVLEGE